MTPWDPERHGPRRVVGPGFHDRVFALVRRVPAGRVVTYGDLAHALGRRGVARQVGWALASLPAGSDVPWWRVVAAAGRVPRAGTACARRHAVALRAEGVRVVRDRVVDFAARQWQP
ncbi:MAG: MGMT family protein [Planctomycetota bacterium]